jgi:hypothetical protein
MAFVLFHSGEVFQTLTTPSSQDLALFGHSVAGVGDISGDGRPDVLVGAPHQHVGTNLQQGQAFVFSGFTGSRLRTLNNPVPQPSAGFGWSVAGAGDINGDGLPEAGDINGDGVPDVVVGAALQDGAQSDEGQVFVFSGADSSPLHTLNSPFPQHDAFFGWSVAGTRDINGDGVPDVVVGAPEQVKGGFRVGRAFVFASESRLADLMISQSVDKTSGGQRHNAPRDYVLRCDHH